MRWVAALVGLAGCSLVLDADRHTGNDAGMDGARPPIRSDQACAEFATVLCEARLRCCVAAAGENLGDCSIDFQRQCLENLGAWVANPEAGYDATKAAQVLDAVEEASVACDGAAVMQILVHDFFDIAQGSRPAGAACNPIADPVEATYCTGPLECLNTGGALVGTWACGEPRSDGEECVTYLECEGELGCPDLVCAPPLSNGETCRTGGDCRSGLCDREGPTAVFGTCVAAERQRVFCSPLLANPGPTAR